MVSYDRDVWHQRDKQLIGGLANVLGAQLRISVSPANTTPCPLLEGHRVKFRRSGYSNFLKKEKKNLLHAKYVDEVGALALKFLHSPKVLQY